jgi:hypothetical protein
MTNYVYYGKIDADWSFELRRHSNKIRFYAYSFGPYRRNNSRVCGVSRYKAIKYFNISKKTLSKVFNGTGY